MVFSGERRLFTKTRARADEARNALYCLDGLARPRLQIRAAGSETRIEKRFCCYAEALYIWLVARLAC